ncbi:hypothetical protein H257_17255 [Aphanomyces astaci]|uniref:PX domain-containing protein n=1 Tax=Aphanomyces astaci TaxID=112090 RepID=W4FHR4_APHAT|nr:hypothetical protein H257_17255 [Aphanomyces astaci]ETV66288.1 hypothetical protein H257_17255 [Aphanomyces astaci]|eukprot:XP_009844275.1 hypothetical protein H257_17255 [Aphanomyces astaci]
MATNTSYSPNGMTEIIVTRRNSFNGLTITTSSLSSSSTSHHLLRPARNSHSGIVHDVGIVSTAGFTYDSIYVMDKVVVSHGTVYYLLHVASQAYPLESYTIRRRYNDFKTFHASLSRHMRPEPFSLFKGGHHSTNSPTHSIDEDHAFSFSPSSTTSHWQLQPQQQPPNDSGDVAATLDTITSSSLPYIEEDDVVYLPPMPHGGLLTIMTSKESLVRGRIAQFNRILQAALDDTSAPVADALKTFIKQAPGGRTSRPSSFADSSSRSLPTSSHYVSLRDYVVPELCVKLEREARRRTASTSRSRALPDDLGAGSFHSRDSTTSTCSATTAAPVCMA